VLSPRNGTPGSRWEVPPDLHEPIRQDAVLLNRAAGNAAARGFLDYLRGDAARAVIETYGYGG
jgi:molybdate transport system substrate-binding protein